jgi:hypothetical protein
MVTSQDASLHALGALGALGAQRAGTARRKARTLLFHIVG